jgi:hypothetical protein
LGIVIFKDGLSDPFDIIESLFVEFNRVVFGNFKKINDRFFINGEISLLSY